MSEPRVAPCGSWISPLGAEAAVAAGVGLGDIVLDGADSYWTEARPAQRGRVVLVRRGADGSAEDLTPEGYSVLSRVHEYGGGAFAVRDGTVYFVNLDDQQIHRQFPSENPTALTGADGLRFADLTVDPQRGRLLAVCEDHRAGGEPVNTLVGVDERGDITILAAGADFYSSPALSPDGCRMAWLSWNHPDMPWDSCELWLTELDAAGLPRTPECIAGGAGESICQPQWNPAGVLHFVSDRSGWWNLHRWHDDRVEPLAPRAAEFGLPHWVFAQSTYAFTDDGRLYCAYCEQGLWRLARWAPNGELIPLDTPYSRIDGLQACGSRLVFRAGAPDRPTAIVERGHDGRLCELRRAASDAPDPGYLSRPEPIRFATEGVAEAHAFFYPPANRDFRAPEGERPPLLVIGHGGPTSATSTALNPQIQFWTSRGFAVVDVDYRGSTGYGRAYHQALDGGWGVVDVADCVAAARHLIEQGRVDGARCAIRGRSAGGYSTLAALTFHDLFRAGASYYGISDLEVLASDTHKFESRYLDRLIGPWPEAREVYRQRSPIHHVERLNAPVIFFQGLEDRVVPPNQAERMVAALRDKGLPVAYIAFPDERHGFRQAANLCRALEAELYFYGRLFGFTPADRLTPVPIDNLDETSD